MNRQLQVAKGLSAEVLILMADSQELRGRVFLADQAQNHSGRETLLDVLNQSVECFIPFAQDDEDDVVLINKSRIVGVQPRDPGREGWPHRKNDDDSCWPRARIVFAGVSLAGWVFTGDLPSTQHRPADLLNHGHPYFVFDTDDGPWIVNRDLLNLLVPLT